LSRPRRLAASLLALLPAALCIAVLYPGAALATEGSASAAPPAEAVASEATPTDPAGSPAPPGEIKEVEPEESSGTSIGGGGAAGPGQRPQLLLFHGGSFLYDDPYFEPLTRPRALAAGFVPHYVTYPLGDLPAAVTKARAEARRLRDKFGVSRVYAYGSSAGGTLTALLSGDGLVEAAVAKAPVSDLATWEWPTEKYGPTYWEGLGVDLAARQRLSPMNRAQRSPLLVIQGRADNIVPPSMNEAFAARFRRVRLWMVAGGHTTDRVRPYLVTRAMHWLALIASQKARAAQNAVAAR
jgi:pimeloyl-ACP methyl ester carboxylesterase